MFLPETLASIRESCRRLSTETKEPVEIIVVDNDSTDGTVQVAETFGARVVRQPVRNIAAVRNAGIKAALAPIVITVDADTYVPPEAVLKILAVMRSGEFIGGGVRTGLRTKRIHFRATVYIFEKLMVLFTGLSGGLFFFERQAALEFGGFPETHLIAEDMTFAKRLREFGQAKGKKFCNLRSVTILTFDRKNISFGKSLKALYTGIRAYFGAEIQLKDVDYWYRPGR